MEIFKHSFIPDTYFITDNKLELFINFRNLLIPQLDINKFFVIKNNNEYYFISNNKLKLLFSPIYLNLNNINNPELTLIFS